MKRAQINVSFAVRTEGGLLPADLLQAIQDKKTVLDGLKPEHYHLEGEKINDAIGRAWNRALTLWDNFCQAKAAIPETDLGTSVTRDKWILPLFTELGYGRIQPSKAFEINGKVFPISHVWQRVPIHTLGFKLELDHRTEGARGASRSIPHSMLQEFLNHNDDYLWGILTNGLKLRLLRDSVSLTRQAYLEFDLEEIMEGELYSDFAIFWLLCHQSRLEGEKPSDFWLEKWSKSAKDIGTRALDQLRGGVETAISELGRGFLRHPANQDLRKKLRDGVVSKDEYYRQLLRLVYRFIFFCVAEERGVLLAHGTTVVQKERYDQYYSVTRLRRIAEKIRGSSHSDLYESFRLLCQLVSDKGLPDLGLNPLGSFLFSGRTAPDVEPCKISNKDFLKAVYALSVISENNVVRHVDYKSLKSEELGSVYEALLELHPALDIENSDFNLATAAGHERRQTGSYYTPESLVQCLLDTTLDPVIAERLKGKNKADAELTILNLKVCDPACGSGHFLIGAAHRIARHLARVRSGETEPSPQESRKALRDVISHCLYGVDINPMSVELCKLALWMEALEPGKPLSFLEHRIKCGNSLLGATPKLITEGIPDSAFDALDGDDKKYCSLFRKKNKSESRQGSLFDQSGGIWSVARDLGKDAYQVGQLNSETLEDIKAQENKYNSLHSSEKYTASKFIADAWCTAFFIDKSGKLEYPITNDVFQHLKSDSKEIPDWLKAEIDAISKEYAFFQWHVEFPEVFQLPVDGEKPTNELMGWSGGFDCVIGNPPWQAMSPDRSQFFGRYIPDFRAKSEAEQEEAIAILLQDPAISKDWHTYTRYLYSSVRFMKSSGRYTRFAEGNLGKGDFNVYRMFVEHALDTGLTAAQVLPGAFATGANTSAIRRYLLSTKRLTALYVFDNIKRQWFDVSVNSLTIYSAGPNPTGKPFAAAFQIGSMEELLNLRENLIHFSHQEVIDQSPELYSVPSVRNQFDADLTAKLYKAVPRFGAPVIHYPHRDLLREVDMGIDRGLFNSEKSGLPIYEGRMIDRYDYRAKQYLTGRGASSKWGTNKFSSPAKTIKSQWNIAIPKIPDKLGDRWKHYRVVYGNIADPSMQRSVVATLVPPNTICGDTVPTILAPGNSEWVYIVWLAALNSFTFDFIARKQLASKHLTMTLLDSLPLPRLNATDDAFLPLGKAVIGLQCTGPEMDGYRALLRTQLDPSKRCIADASPLTTDEARAEAEAALDALVAKALFKISRQEYEFILNSFSVIRQNEEKDFGAYKSKERCLAAFDIIP